MGVSVGMVWLGVVGLCLLVSEGGVVGLICISGSCPEGWLSECCICLMTGAALNRRTDVTHGPAREMMSPTPTNALGQRGDGEGDGWVWWWG